MSSTAYFLVRKTANGSAGVLTDISPEEEQTMIALLERMARNLGWDG